MAVQTPPYALQASSHSAELFRRAVTAACTGTGVISFPDLKVTQNTGADLKCQVAAGQNLIPGTLGSATGMPPNPNAQTAYTGALANFTSQGVYYGFNDAAITALAFTSAHATLNRIDLVVATVQDAFYSGATNNWVIQVVTGTAAGSPVAPAIPANTLVLAEVSIAAAATAVVNANITDKRPFARFGLSASNIQTNGVVANEICTSSSAVDLATVGPTCAVIVPSSGIIQVSVTATIQCSASGQYGFMYFTMSGANTMAAQQTYSLFHGNFVGASSTALQATATFLMTGLAAGATTLVAKYARAFSGNVSFSDRKMIVQTFP